MFHVIYCGGWDHGAGEPTGVFVHLSAHDTRAEARETLAAWAARRRLGAEIAWGPGHLAVTRYAGDWKNTLVYSPTLPLVAASAEGEIRRAV